MLLKSIAAGQRPISILWRRGICAGVGSFVLRELFSRMDSCLDWEKCLLRLSYPYAAETVRLRLRLRQRLRLRLRLRQRLRLRL